MLKFVNVEGERMMKKIVILMLLAMISTSSIAFAGSFKANAKTKRVAAGTQLELQFLEPVTTSSGAEGNLFTAALNNEIKTDSTVILPLGTVVRGSISEIKSAKRFSRGAKLYIDFDHVVTPNGIQIPLDLSVVSYNDKIYYDGGLYKNLGYGEAVKTNFEKGVDITKKATEYGLDVGVDHPGMQYITTPFCAIGGFLGGVGYWFGDSIADMFRKGEEVYINKGDIMKVRLNNPIDVPVY